MEHERHYTHVYRWSYLEVQTMNEGRHSKEIEKGELEMKEVISGNKGL